MLIATRAPGATKARLNEAIIALQRGQFKAALSIAREAAQTAPDDPHAWWVLSMAAHRIWLYDEAEQALAKGAELLAHDPARQAEFTTRRATILTHQGRNVLAAQAARQSLANGLLNAGHVGLLGSALLSAGHAEEAIPVLTRAALLDPKLADSWFNLGRAHEAIGRMDAVENFYEKAIAAGYHTGAHVALARLKRWTEDNNHIERLLKLPANNFGDVSRIQSALFKEFDDLGRRAEAWVALERSNHAALNQIMPSPSGVWGTEDEAQPIRVGDISLERGAANVEAWKQYFPVGRFAEAKRMPGREAPAGPRRIFIIGLPRSGTTLIERILAAHSQVQVFGELQVFPIATKRLSQIKGGGILNPEVIASAATVDPGKFADIYNQKTAELHNGRPYTVDKLPHNYEYAGLIRLAFPDAIIIEARREPMDALFSAYKLLMGSDYLWIYRLKDLARHYGDYSALMTHWRACLGDIIPFSNEALVANPHDQIRHLLTACGLPFETACLTPHKAQGTGITSSSAQVRSPINADGVGAWRKYEAQLAPLHQQLQEMGLLDGEGDGGDLTRPAALPTWNADREAG